MGKIGIVMATYNGEKYLPEMLDSLVAQKRPADFIVVVDDGSRDRTPEILKNYENRLPLQVTVLPQNMGHRAAFSKALELAQPQLGEDDLIALADQDDIWLPQKLEILEKAIETAEPGKRKPDLVFGDAEVVDSDGKTIGKSWREMDGITPNLSLRALLTGFTNVTGCMTLFRASLLSKILPIPEKTPVHDQWITFCASARNGCKSISEPVIKYRIHGQNAIGLGKKYTWTDRLKINLQWSEMITGTPHFKELSAGDQDFLRRYIVYVRDRLNKPLIPQHLFWIAKNARNLYPHIAGFCGLVPRILYGVVGAPIITKIRNKH